MNCEENVNDNALALMEETTMECNNKIRIIYTSWLQPCRSKWIIRIKMLHRSLIYWETPEYAVPMEMMPREHKEISGSCIEMIEKLTALFVILLALYMHKHSYQPYIRTPMRICLPQKNSEKGDITVPDIS
jgi:hypothetical protein